MFDMGWLELAVVGLIMVLVLGPKELPHAMRSIARFMRKAKRLASEFQGHLDEIVREAELDEVRKTVQSIKNQDVNALINDAVDPGGEIKKELEGTVADAKKEMNEIKASAGPRPSSQPQTEAAAAGDTVQTETVTPIEPAPTTTAANEAEAQPAKASPAKPETPAPVTGAASSA